MVAERHPDGIRHLPSKRYQARFLGPDGRSHSNTFQTTRDAAAWLSQQRAAISADKWEKRETLVVVSFADYASHWLAGRELAMRTREGYTDLLDRYILDTFGSRPIHAISRDEVAAWFARTARDHPTSRARAYGLLRTILGSAVDDGHLATNPARIRGAGQVSRRHQIRPATLDELAALTEAMPSR